jgi:hypothetical protein
MIIFDTGGAEIGESDDDERARVAVGLGYRIAAAADVSKMSFADEFCAGAEDKDLMSNGTTRPQPGWGAWVRSCGPDVCAMSRPLK